MHLCILLLCLSLFILKHTHTHTHTHTWWLSEVTISFMHLHFVTLVVALIWSQFHLFLHFSFISDHSIPHPVFYWWCSFLIVCLPTSCLKDTHTHSTNHDFFASYWHSFSLICGPFRSWLFMQPSCLIGSHSHAFMPFTYYQHLFLFVYATLHVSLFIVIPLALYGYSFSIIHTPHHFILLVLLLTHS